MIRADFLFPGPCEGIVHGRDRTVVMLPTGRGLAFALGEENGLQPTVFYRWQKEFFENGASAFQAKERPIRQVEEKQKRIEFLEKKVQTKGWQGRRHDFGTTTRVDTDSSNLTP
jgi:hypothetical protein